MYVCLRVKNYSNNNYSYILCTTIASEILGPPVPISLELWGLGSLYRAYTGCQYIMVSVSFDRVGCVNYVCSSIDSTVQHTARALVIDIPGA